jgi:hypothetical protein
LEAVCTIRGDTELISTQQFQAFKIGLGLNMQQLKTSYERGPEIFILLLPSLFKADVAGHREEEVTVVVEVVLHWKGRLPDVRPSIR